MKIKFGKLLDLALPFVVTVATRFVQKRAEKREKKELDTDA